MAFDSFLKLSDGRTARGESTDARHPLEIELLSFEVTAANAATVGGGGGTAGRAQVSTFKVTKRVDASSPVLFQTCCGGTVYPTAVVTIRRAGGRAAQETLVYTFTQVYVSRVTTAGAAGRDDTPTETVELSFATIHIRYVPQRPDGSGGAAIEGGWDLTRNQPK
ncbi:MAG: type VI secretion system tube protein Hcp [Gemmataceae bacterium]